MFPPGLGGEVNEFFKENSMDFDVFVFFKVKAERSSGDFWEMWGMTFQQILKDADFLLIVAWWLMVEGWCSI